MRREKTNEGQLPAPRQTEIPMEETLLKFERLLVLLRRRNVKPDDRVNLLEELRPKRILFAHMRNLETAIQCLDGVPKETLQAASKTPLEDAYPLNDSVVNGSSQSCVKNNLTTPILAGTTTDTNLDHVENAMRIMHAWARLNEIRRKGY